MISGIMLSWNSAQRIRTAIDSLWKVADEIIVVDSNSADSTKQIADEMGCQVYNRDFEKDFSALRNFAISKAKGDYVLWLDTDEYFDDECIENLPKMPRKFPDAEAFVIERKNFMDGKRYAIGDAHVRLFRSYLKFVRPVDEVVLVRRKAIRCPGFVIHEKTTEEQTEKQLRRKMLGWKY
jgi:glycosyltransferase involved in cell wall biosynthesis